MVVADRGGSDLEDGGGGGVAVARLGNVRQFGLRELQAATDGFAARHILGKGGFGNVYRGRLADGTTVAVKRLNDPASASGEAQFRTEVEMISLRAPPPAPPRRLLRRRRGAPPRLPLHAQRQRRVAPPRYATATATAHRTR